MKRLGKILFTIFGSKPQTVQPVSSQEVPLAQSSSSPSALIEDVLNGQENPEKEWLRLLERVKLEMGLVQGEVKEMLEGDFADLLVEKSPGRIVRKALHLRSKIQRIREAVSQEPSEVREEFDSSAPSRFALPAPSLELVLKALLPIDEHVPSYLNPEIVRKVILTFLRPGNEVPHLGASYTSLEDLRKRLREVHRDEMDKILGWLRRTRILIERPHKKAGRTLVSLRMHAKDVGSPGREIIQIIARAAYEKARMG